MFLVETLMGGVKPIVLEKSDCKCLKCRDNSVRLALPGDIGQTGFSCRELTSQFPRECAAAKWKLSIQNFAEEIKPVALEIQKTYKIEIFQNSGHSLASWFNQD